MLQKLVILSLSVPSPRIQKAGRYALKHSRAALLLMQIYLGFLHYKNIAIGRGR